MSQFMTPQIRTKAIAKNDIKAKAAYHGGDAV
jgi:hypothetical protein